MWFIAAILSAVFAGMTAILSKCGIKHTKSNLATAIRTSVVFVFAWFIVWITGAYQSLSEIGTRSWIFLILSGLATGASWLCYYYAIQQGQVSIVVPIDKLSILITVFFSLPIFKERLSKKAVAGLCLLTAGTVLMAILT